MVVAMADKIICSRYNNVIQDLTCVKEKIRIGSSSIRRIKTPSYILISTNGNHIYYKDKIFTVRSFFSQQHKFPLMVLTSKEYELLYDIAIEQSLKIYVFESLFPIFPDIKYISDIEKSYQYLLSLYEIVKKGDTHGIPLGKYYVTKFLYKTERKLKFKNSLDVIFAHAYKTGFQEVFKFKEEDKNRIVIALDFNSMYASCMMEKFMEPKSLKYIPITEIDNYSDALIRVTLKEPKSDFIKNFHPFKYTRLFNSQIYKLKCDSSIEIQLFKDEFLFYKQFFKNYEIHSAISSKVMLWHPLRRDAINLYKERLIVKNNNAIKEKIIKYQLSTMHSCTNQKKFDRFKNQTIDDLKSHIFEKFHMINIESDELQLIKDKNDVYIEPKDNRYSSKIVRLDSPSNVFSISARITARAELALMKMINRFVNFKTVELCYSNVDSIHISVDSSYKEAFFEKFERYIGSEMGQLKVESIADNGYWFDSGRYWLMDRKGTVQKFANISFNRRGYDNPFIFNKKIRKHVKGELIDYSDVSYKSVMSSFSYKKKLNVDKNIFERYDFCEIKNLIVAKQTYLNEKDLTKNVKSSVIKSLPSKFVLIP